MGLRKNHTDLENEVYNAWDELSFRDGGFAGVPKSRQELIESQIQRRPEWDAILAKAFDGEKWLVGCRIASTITTSRWWNAMTLGDYERAVAEIERCLKHPEPFERLDKAQNAVKLGVARFGLTRGDLGSAEALVKVIHSGTYSRATIARHVGYLLHSLVEDLDSSELVPQSASDLLSEIALRVRAGKGLTKECSGVATWAQFSSALSKLLWPKRAAQLKMLEATTE